MTKEKESSMDTKWLNQYWEKLVGWIRKCFEEKLNRILYVQTSLKEIKLDDALFQSEEYFKDKYLYFIFEKKINNENAKIMSDGENYIITNESVDTNPWIWTKNNFDKSKLSELEELIRLYLVKDKMTFTCKKELYDALLKDNFELIDKSTYFELWFMKCEKLKDTKPNDGRLDKAKMEEKNLIADYIYKFNDFQDDHVSHYSSKTDEQIKAECLQAAENEINDENFYVLRNSDNKIVCMAHYRINSNWTGKVWLVYTPDEERWKWYAAKLVHELTKMLLEKWYIPILYTDQNYPNSNKAYANTWYENGWTLVCFTCDKNKNVN